MTDYDVRAAATAARVLRPKAQGGKGQPITIVHFGPAAYDPTTGTNSPTQTTQTGCGVVLEYNTFIRSGVRDEPGSLIQKGDKQMLLSPLKTDGTALIPPVAGDTVTTISGDSYTVTSVGALAPAGTTVYFECNVRGAP